MTTKNLEEQLELIAEKQLEWLKDHGCTFADVLCDDESIEYILDETEEGVERINLPDFSQE